MLQIGHATSHRQNRCRFQENLWLHARQALICNNCLYFFIVGWWIWCVFDAGATRDNFWGETYTLEDKSEKWCGVDVPLLPSMSGDGFRLLRDRSFLYSQMNYLPKYKLIAADAELLQTSIHVNNFYCQPAVDDDA